MLPQIWVTQYIRKFNVLNNQNAILICSILKKKKLILFQSSGSILWSRMFLQMLKMVVQSIA